MNSTPLSEANLFPASKPVLWTPLPLAPLFQPLGIQFHINILVGDNDLALYLLPPPDCTIAFSMKSAEDTAPALFQRTTPLVEIQATPIRCREFWKLVQLPHFPNEETKIPQVNSLESEQKPPNSEGHLSRPLGGFFILSLWYEFSVLKYPKQFHTHCGCVIHVFWWKYKMVKIIPTHFFS